MKYAIFLSIIFISSNFRLFSQTSDMDLIKQHYKTSTSSRSVNFGITESKNVFLKYNPIKNNSAAAANAAANQVDDFMRNP